jgi:hypothetical protein
MEKQLTTIAYPAYGVELLEKFKVWSILSPAIIDYVLALHPQGRPGSGNGNDSP